MYSIRGMEGGGSLGRSDSMAMLKSTNRFMCHPLLIYGRSIQHFVVPCDGLPELDPGVLQPCPAMDKTVSPPYPLLAQVDGRDRVLAVGIRLGVSSNLVIYLAAAYHDLHVVAQSGFPEAPDRVLH